MRYAIAAMLILCAGASAELRPQAGQEPGPRFAAVPVHIDSGNIPLAAWQFDFTAAQGRFKVVGVEGGEHAAYREAPYFDRQAVEQGRADRIIVAAFSTAPAAELPTGRTRVATVHVMAEGDVPPVYRVQMTAAATVGGHAIAAKVELEEGLFQ